VTYTKPNNWTTTMTTTKTMATMTTIATTDEDQILSRGLPLLGNKQPRKRVSSLIPRGRSARSLSQHGLAFAVGLRGQ
jgi:hypothetical protein